ncbi:3-ketosphinganine reductase [Myriangium duriaei CBS 260.36]|uniref:3-dehydrosphinganine reductase n=1 Tax=Myriangium duriaei CBS 260.36 TaxID=1168546 RepID=A0A9P4MEI3_9PEZI|nr:3-ketosphinganine reductase [Myriangium duriaei CBS 260.36]
MLPIPVNTTSTLLLGAVLAIFFYVAADIMGLFSSKNKFIVDGRTVLLTGGSQGMGKGLAKLLAQKGANVVIVARNQAKLDETLEYIKAVAKSPSQRFHAISADVTDPDESTRILQETTTWNNNTPPDIVWANAGSAHPALFIDTPVSLLRSQMEINYWGAAYLSHAALNLFLRPSSSSSTTTTEPRHIIMTSSVAAFVGLAGYAPYSPAKAAMRNLADVLRQEVQMYHGARRGGKPGAPERDVEIHIVFPGTILSPGLEQENKSKHAVTKVLEEGDAVQTEDEVAAAAIKGLEKGEFMVTTQWLGAIMRGAMIGGSRRNNLVVDTLIAWLTSIVWLFVRPDLDGKVWGYGKKNGLTEQSPAGGK